MNRHRSSWSIMGAGTTGSLQDADTPTVEDYIDVIQPMLDVCYRGESLNNLIEAIKVLENQ